MGLQDLSHVHAGGHAQRVEHEIHRRAVRQVGHVLLRQDHGDHALVAVAAGHLVAHGDLALLGDVDADQCVHAGRELIPLLPAEHLHGHDLALFAVGHLQ